MWKIVVENPEQFGLTVREFVAPDNRIARMGVSEGQSYCFVEGYHLIQEEDGRFVSEDLDDGAFAHLHSVFDVDEVKYEYYRI